jgi:hypothetical protein
VIGLMFMLVRLVTMLVTSMMRLSTGMVTALPSASGRRRVTARRATSAGHPARAQRSLGPPSPGVSDASTSTSMTSGSGAQEN